MLRSNSSTQFLTGAKSGTLAKMHRSPISAVALALSLLAASCSSEPQLASERDGATTTSSSTSTTSTTSSTTIMVTTTTEEPGPDPSDVLRIAYDELLEFDSLSYTAHTDSDTTLEGAVRSTTTGTWNRSGSSELHLAVGLEEEFTYRFPGDGNWWLDAIGDNGWLGYPVDTEPGPSIEPASDAATYLDPFFSSIVEVLASFERDGQTIYPLVLEADTIVPAVSPSSTTQNLFDAGWDGVSEEMAAGEIALGPDGDLRSASVDGTPWWNAGWHAAGVSEFIGNGTVEWAIEISPNATEVEFAPPCSSPTTEFDEELGVDALVCP
ncbi:MAG: hypothetical protein ACI9MX_000621 [Candidatus Aldehydirespiratoraceae bacterium]|jgi:hypothetical protein